MALHDLVKRMRDDEEFGLDVVDYMLHHAAELQGQYEHREQGAVNLAETLAVAGSVWEVAETDDRRAFRLSRRAVGPVRDAIEAIPATTRGHDHLVHAWNRLSGRNPDPSSAYREAIRAVEAVAKSVILPASDRATLGTMITAMRDKPEKWEVSLGTVDEVRQMMELVWTNQLDRHGTDDETVPLNVTLDQADVAVHVCLALVRMFAGGHVRAAGSATS